MAVNIQYNYLDEEDGSIRLEFQGTADFIVGRRVRQSTTVEVLDEYVAEANRGQGYGEELVEEFLEACIAAGIRRVEIKSNENRSWWEKAKRFRNGYMIHT